MAEQLARLVTSLFVCVTACTTLARDSRPNLILIVADDLGWGDVGCYGAANILTPHIDRLAEEGVRFTDFYAAAPFCSASRAALLTGRYPTRCGVPYVLFPAEHHGLPPDELTLAEHLKENGYVTACIGKWHLGWGKPFHPARHGFDVFFGLPYSNDSREWSVGEPFAQVLGLQPLPLMDGDRVVEAPADQAQLTRRYTERALEFIRGERNNPFFLYLAHTMPHIPQYASAQFAGKSRAGLYGDTVQELDWSVGQVLDAVREMKLERKTVLLFSSDNGAVIRPRKWQTEKGAFPGRNFGGNNGVLRGAKGQTFEGGMRVPGIFWGPGRIEAGKVVIEPVSQLDVFPTFSRFAGIPLPEERVFDGQDLGPLLQGRRAPARKPFFYYFGPQLQAVREGPWKLFLPVTSSPADAPESLWYVHQPGLFERHHRLWPKATLYQLDRDPGEQNDLAAQHPEIVERLTMIGTKFDAALSPCKRALFKVDGPRPPSPGQIRKAGDDLRHWKEQRR